MDSSEIRKDLYETTTIKKEPEETIDASNDFDAIENVPSPQFHCKEEVDLKWDVKDNNYDVDDAILGTQGTDKSIENAVEYDDSIIIHGTETKGIVKIENFDTGKGEIQGNLHIQENLYKEELNLDWDEKDNNYCDVSHSTDDIEAAQLEKTKPTPILQTKESKSKRRKNNASSSRKQKTIESPDTEKECPRCKKRLKNQNTLRKHLFYCGKEAHLQCDSCSYKAKYKNVLIYHITRNHPEQIPKFKRKATRKKGNKISKTRKEHELSDKCLRFCKTCKVSIDDRKINKCHQCESQLLFRCSKCNELFSTHDKLTRHTIDKCDPIGYYHCPACDFKATFKKSVKCHLKGHLTPGSHIDVEEIKWKRVEGKGDTTNSQSFTCPSCNKQFKRQVFLANHLRFCIKSQGVSKPPANYIEKKDPGHKYMVMKHCRKCNTNYMPEKGKNHKNECCGSMMSFKCLKCNRWYERLLSIQYHVINICNLQVKDKCSMCDYEGSKNGLMRHLKSKHDFQCVECPICKTKVKNKFTLKQHLCYCRRERLKCEHCPYTTTRKYELKLHIFQKHMG